MRDEFGNSLPQRSFAKQDHPPQTGFLYGPNKPLCMSVQIGRLWWQLYTLHASTPQGRQKLSRVQRIAIMNQLSLSSQETVDIIR
jgi:hypothetical protein